MGAAAELLRSHRGSVADQAPAGVVTVEFLAALDDARDYASASSSDWLNAELGRLRQVARAGGGVRVEEETGPVVLATDADFAAWAGGRYPAAQPAD